MRPAVPDLDVAAGRAGQDAPRLPAVGAGQVVDAQGEVAKVEGDFVATGSLDVSELLAHLRKLEDARRALERVLGLGQLSGLERVGQRIVRGGREGGEGPGLLLRGGERGESERGDGKESRKAQQSQRWCRLPHV